MPVLGTAGEEGLEPEIGALGLVNVNGGEAAVAAGDIEAEVEAGFDFANVSEFERR